MESRSVEQGTNLNLSQLKTESLIHRLGMEMLFSIEMFPKAASRVLAVVFAVRDLFLFFGGLSQPDPAEALGATKRLILQVKRLFDRHPLPPKDASFRCSMPPLDFYFHHFGHAFSPLPSCAADGHFIQFDSGHAYAHRDALSCLAACADALIEFEVVTDH